MLVKNTIIALMAVAPALSIPVPAAGTVATTKATVATKAPTTKAPATAQRVSGASVKTAERTVLKDLATDKTLKAELRQAEARLGKDVSSARGLEKTKLSQDATDRAARKVKTLKAPGSKLKAPGSKLKTPGSKSSINIAKTMTKAFAAAREKSLHRHTTTSHVMPGHHSDERLLKNKNGLRINTGRNSGIINKHLSPSTPGSGRTSRFTGGSQYGLSGPGTGFQSQYSPSSPWTGGIQSPPWSGGLNGMTEDISLSPQTGGGYTERVSWKEDRAANQFARRATIPDTPTSTLNTPVSPPLGPFSALLQKHKTGKAAKHHQHTMTEALQLTQMLVEAEKVVNGLEEQMNKRPTVFHNLKRKSALKRLRAPRTPTTPATPVTPVTPVTSAVKST